MPRPQNRQPDEDDSRPVRIGRREFPVIGRVRIRERTYLLLKQLSPAPRQRYQAFDPLAGPKGDLRAVHLYQPTEAALQLVKVLTRLPKKDQSLPHILDYEASSDELRLALNWVEGLDLKNYLDLVRQGRVVRPSPFGAVRLVRGLAHGLRILNHHAQVIHGDLKPANLILTRKPSDLVMIDFGSAWLVERTAFRLDGDGVSSVYAAPELQNGDAGINARADQFSVSVILFELLTLALPYANLGGKVGRVEFRSATTPPLESPSQLIADPGGLPIRIGQEMDHVVCRGLALNADDRFPTNSEWLNAIEEFFQLMKAPSSATDREPDVLGRVVNWFGRKLGGQSR